MPHADHRVIFGLAAMLLPALLAAASPAAAEPARSRIRVAARALPACEVSTDDTGAAATACTAGTQGSISVERRLDALDPDRPVIARAAEGGDSTPRVTWVTITY